MGSDRKREEKGARGVQQPLHEQEKSVATQAPWRDRESAKVTATAPEAKRPKRSSGQSAEEGAE